MHDLQLKQLRYQLLKIQSKNSFMCNLRLNNDGWI